MSTESRRLSAIMFADMVGYTALGQRNESLSLALVKELRGLLRPVFARHRGREVKTMGDAFLVEFPSALDALRGAYDVQRATRDLNLSLPEDRRAFLRVGVHVGDGVESEDDISGDAVNVASRVEPLAEPGGICISQQVYDHVRNKTELVIQKIGEIGLKNVESPLGVYRIVLPWDGSNDREPPASRERLAVLPFVNISPDPKDEYFSDGMTEELIGRLSGIRGLKVIARTSIMNYKGKGKKVSEIGRELGVGSVIEGSVRKAGTRIRVSVQLVDARTEEHLWASSYDKELDDVFSIQSDVASKVAASLAGGVFAEGFQEDTENLQSYTLFLKALQLDHEGSTPSLRQATALLDRAIRLDPAFVRAHAKLAHAWARLAMSGREDYSVVTEKAEPAARKALELDPESAEAHAAMAEVHTLLDRYEESIAEAERAIRINPNLVSAHLTLGLQYCGLGRLDQALAAFRTAYELDPVWDLTGISLVTAALAAGKEAEAFAVLERLKLLSPSNPDVWVALADFYISRKEFGTAQELLDKSLREWPGYPPLMVNQGIVYALTGRKQEAEATLRTVETGANEQAKLHSEIWIHTALGNFDEVFGALSRLAEIHAWPVFLPTDPFFEELRRDPRYLDFRRKVQLPPL